jgi:hypothetical protein
LHLSNRWSADSRLWDSNCLINFPDLQSGKTMIFRVNLWDFHGSFLNLIQVIHQFHHMKIKHFSFSSRSFLTMQTNPMFFFEFRINYWLSSYHCDCFEDVQTIGKDEIVKMVMLILIARDSFDLMKENVKKENERQ